jgi:hypothetical protein
MTLQNADPMELGILVAGLVAAAVFGLWQAFHRLRKARAIEDVPTAKIRSAPQGYVELVGEAQAMQGEPIIAPLSKEPCCWYRYSIESRKGGEWSMVRREASDGLFLIRDDTGECIVDPEGAEVTPKTRRVWFGDDGDALTVVVPPRGAEGLRLGPVIMRPTGGLDARYRYTEEIIHSDDPLYALGDFKTLDDIDHHQSRSEITAAILREWKADQARLLQRFDHDRDGRIDVEEWEDARRVAAQRAEAEHQEQLAHQHVHTLRAPAAGGRPYLLSSLPQTGLARRYRWQAFGALLMFLVASGALVAIWRIP